MTSKVNSATFSPSQVIRALTVVSRNEFCFSEHTNRSSASGFTGASHFAETMHLRVTGIRLRASNITNTACTMHTPGKTGFPGK